MRKKEGPGPASPQAVLKTAAEGRLAPAYVFIGERPLTRPWITGLIAILLPEDVRDFNLDVCDGERATEGEILERLTTRPFFPGRKVVWLRETPFFQSRHTVASRWKRIRKLVESGERRAALTLMAKVLASLDVSPRDLVGMSGARLAEVLTLPKGEPTAWLVDLISSQGEDWPTAAPLDPGQGERLLAWLTRDADPSRAVLLMEAEEVDRRGGFFKQIDAIAPVLDLAPREKGRGRDGWGPAFVRERLSAAGKTIEPAAMDLLLAQVGQEERVALQTEVEKLVNLAGERPRITRGDVGRIVARHREEAIFELIEAIGARDLGPALASLRRLLAQDVHALALLASIANFLRRMIMIRSALEAGPGISAVDGASYEAFQQGVLPALREAWGDLPPASVSGIHPYALYRLCGHAKAFNLDHLLEVHASMVDCDLALKGGRTSPAIVLEALILRVVEGAHS